MVERDGQGCAGERAEVTGNQLKAGRGLGQRGVGEGWGGKKAKGKKQGAHCGLSGLRGRVRLRLRQALAKGLVAEMCKRDVYLHVITVVYTGVMITLW